MHDFIPGTAHIAAGSEPFKLKLRDSNIIVARFSPRLIQRFADRLCSTGASNPLSLDRQISMKPATAQSFWRYLTYLWRESRSGSNIFASSSVAGELESTLLSLLLFSIDDQVGGLLRPQDAYVSPVHVRRAQDYIGANLLNPVSLADIAEAAGVSARTLTRAFQDRHGTSPIAYLRQLRLESAQRELLAADPAAETVTNVALKYGFYDPGRFATYYRKAFGERPSETLRR